MLTDEKVKQVKKQLRSGMPQGEIENDLINQGYSNEEIQRMIFISSHRKIVPDNSVKDKRNNSITAMLALIGMLCLIAGISMIVVNTWLKPYGIGLIVLGVICLALKTRISMSDE
jgi:DNA-binding CsgD family transcriptional regulator